jgi:uncharacterized membrane protein
MPRDDRSTDDRRLRSSSDERRRSSQERRMFRGTAARLDVPRDLRRTFVPRPTYDADAFGRLSERIARFLGTGQFLVYMTATILLWIGWNIFAPASWRFDQYPFIFLTLALSLQASYAAPLILLAQNRQEARDRVQYERDRDVDARTRADMEFLAREMASLRMAVGEVATRDFLRSELRSLLADLDLKDDRV